MRPGANPADTLGEGPGIAGVTALQNDFQSAPHRTGGDGVSDHVLIVHVHFDTEVTLDPGNRVYDDTGAAIVQREAVGCGGNHDRYPWSVVSRLLFSAALSRARFNAESPAWAATAVPTTPAAAKPI